MDQLDRLLGHDEWTTGECLRRCQELTPDQMRQPFDIGWQSLQATVVHMIGNVRIWTALMSSGVVLDGPAGWEDGSVAELTDQHLETYAAFATLARDVRDRGAESDRWIDTLDSPPRSKTYGGAVLHVITHNMHHRSEVLHMLSRLGLSDLPEGDLLGWEGTQAT